MEAREFEPATRGCCARKPVVAATLGERGPMARADMSRAWRERPFSTFFATGCGIGMIPFAPGTWGSLEGLAAASLAADRWSGVWKPGTLAALVFGLGLAVAAGGIFVSTRTEASCDSRDPGAVVIDEVAGQIIALSPIYLFGLDFWPWRLALASFLLFRLFDIWKPGPIRRLQGLPGGWGIMLDDVAAGLLAGAITFGIGRVF